MLRHVTMGLYAAGIVVRVFHRPRKQHGKRATYRLSRDPAGIGVALAYGWAAVAGAALLIPPEPVL